MQVRNDLLDWFTEGLTAAFKGHEPPVTIFTDPERVKEIERLPAIFVSLPNDAPYLEEVDADGRPIWLEVQADLNIYRGGVGRERTLNDVRQKIDNWIYRRDLWRGLVQGVRLLGYAEGAGEDDQQRSVDLTLGALQFQLIVAAR